MVDSYDIEVLKDMIRAKTGFDAQVIYLEETGSTNVWAGEYIREHDIGETPVLVIADSQTAGKGRLGHTWTAQPGEGISMSLIIDPRMEMRRIPQITLAAGIATRRALKTSAGIEAWVKWPYDILAECPGENRKLRKLCGILCAMSCEKVICGIGINVHTLHLPEEIAQKATSVDLCAEQGASRTRIAAEVITELLILLDTLRDEGWMALKDEYDSHCVNREGRILLTDHLNPGGKKTGTAYGTDEEGRLRVTWDDGKTELLDAGEIELI